MLGIKFCTVYCTDEMKIDSLQNWILVQSIIYYELNDSLVTDKVFDNNCRQLIELIKNNKEVHKGTDLYYIFKDFDGSTGFHLYHRLNKQDKIKYKKKAISALNNRR